MNIQQLKYDRERGISLGRVTIDKLIEAALIMEESLRVICKRDVTNKDASTIAITTLDVVGDM